MRLDLAGIESPAGARNRGKATVKYMGTIPKRWVCDKFFLKITKPFKKQLSGRLAARLIDQVNYIISSVKITFSP